MSWLDKLFGREKRKEIERSVKRSVKDLLADINVRDLLTELRDRASEIDFADLLKAKTWIDKKLDDLKI